MQYINVTVYQDSRGYYPSGYVKVIPIDSRVIGMESLPDPTTADPVIYTDRLRVTHQSFGSIYIGDTAESFATKINAVTCLDCNSDGAGPVATTFSTSIPFTRDYTKMNHTVAGAIAFTANLTGAIDGGGTWVKLIANGVNAPTFNTSLKKTQASEDYDNTEGRINNIFFLNNDGDLEYTISVGAIIAVPDVTAPTVSSRSVLDATHINIVFNEAVSGTIAGYTFTKNGSPLTATAVSGTTTRSFTVGALVAGDVITVAYNSGTGDTVDGSTNALASFTAQSVVNALVPGELLNFTGSSHVIASGNNWVADNAASSYGFLGKATKKLASGTAGGVLAQNISNSSAWNFGLHTSNAEVGYATMRAGISFDKLTGDLYYLNAGSIADLGPVVPANNYMYVYRKPTTNEVVILVGAVVDTATMTEVYSFGVQAGDLFIVLDMGGTGIGGLLVAPRGVNIV